MRLDEFTNGIGRLISQFGRSHYSDERVNLIFQQVRHLPASWWQKTVDKFLLEARQAPLMQEIAAEMAFERERSQTSKRNEQLEPEEGAITFSPEEQAELLKAIRLRAAGALSDEAWANVKSMLNNAIRNTGACVYCDGNGVLTATVRSGPEQGNRYAFRCDCPAGEQDRRAFRRWEPGFESNLLRC